MKKIYIIILLALFSLEINAQNWTILTSGTTNYLQGVAAISPSVCYVCGFSGLIMKTTDGGATWVTQTSNTTVNLYSICFTSATNGVAVGDGGTVLRTTDGSTWNVVSSFTTDGLRNVSFYNASTGYAGGGGSNYGSVFKTTDGGATWNQQANASLNAIYGIKFTSATDGYFCTYGGEIYKTTSGGSSWSAEVSGTTTIMSGLDFPSVNNGFIVGRTGMIRGTTTAGGSWSGITSGTTDALSDVKFADTSVGFIMGINLSTSTGTILKTTDGGVTWAISYPGTPGLIRCSFVNRYCGYGVGSTGTIIKYTDNEGVNEIENNISCDVYPNPSNGKFELSITDKLNKKTIVTVFNSVGELVYTEETEKNNFIIDLSNEAKGIYFAEVKTDKGSVTKKIVIGH